MNNWETITTDKRKAMEARIAELDSENKNLIHDIERYMDIANEKYNRIEQLEQSLQKAYEELETLKENDDEN